MVTQPTDYPDWATLDQVDPVSLQNNVLDPPTNKKLYGFARSEFPPRNWFNWLFRTINDWIKYFDSLASQSKVTSVNDGTPVLFDVVNGGMAKISVIDKTTPANFFEGITYIPPAYSSGTLTFTIESSSTFPHPGHARPHRPWT